MKLTKTDRDYLLSIGENPKDIPQIAEAADITTYELTDEDGKETVRRIGRDEAIKLLGRNGWLNGLDRSAFHYTAMRQTLDNKGYVLFDSSELFKKGDTTMMMTTEMSMPEVVAKIISENTKKWCDLEYLEFLRTVYAAVADDKRFGHSLDLAIGLETGPFPTLRQIERALARMDGCIRPLLEQKGIVKPPPKTEG